MNNGYKDPTAYRAINNVYKEEQERARAKAKRGIDLQAHQAKRKRISERIRAVTYK